MIDKVLIKKSFKHKKKICFKFSLSVLLQMSNVSGQNEEEKLRRKLSELAGNLSEKGLSSDDEPGKKPFSVGRGPAGDKGGPPITLESLKDNELSSSSDELPTEAQKVGRSSGQVICSAGGLHSKQMGTWGFLK